MLKSIKSLLFVLVLPVFVANGAQAAMDKRAIAGLRSLDPVTRLEQVCDLEVMDRVGQDKNNNHEPDRAIGEATDAMKIKGDTLTVTGGALRSHGHWYHLSYVCTGNKNHMKVLEITYKLGKRIPKSEWNADNLWN